MSIFKPFPGQYLTKARSPRVYTSALGNVATPTVAGEAVLFIDSADNVLKSKDSAGNVVAYNTALQYKPSVKAASTTNIDGTYSNNVFIVTTPAVLVLDGITLALNARVLIRAQTTASENGIYDVAEAGNADTSTQCVLTRSAGFDSTPEMVGALVAVEEGTDLADSVWLCNTNSNSVVGSTNIVFTRFLLTTAPAGTLTGGTLASNVLASSLTSVGTLTNLTVTSPITGSVTGSAATVTGSAQAAITSVGTLTSLSVNGAITINGNSVITATQNNSAAFPGSITLSGNNVNGSNGGSINTSGYNNGAARTGGNINTSADTGGNGGFIDTSNNGGLINTTGNGYSLRGGFIITSGNNGGFTLPSSGTGGGYIYTAGNGGGNGGNINTSGSNFGSTARAGGFINTSAGSNGVGGSINTTNNGGLIETRGNNANTGGYIKTSGWNNGGSGNNGGFIDTSANSTYRGGFIATSGNITSIPTATGNGGGYIFTAGNNGGNGGNINTSGFNNSSVARTGGDINTSATGGNNGGSINTSGNTGNAGGNINTSGGGGSITTNGANGNIELGVAASRTTLIGSGTTCTVTLPGVTGTLVTSYITPTTCTALTGTITIAWTEATSLQKGTMVAATTINFISGGVEGAKLELWIRGHASSSFNLIISGNGIVVGTDSVTDLITGKTITANKTWIFQFAYIATGAKTGWFVTGMKGGY